MNKLRVIEWVETNPHYDPERSCNGGGYSWPEYRFRIGNSRKIGILEDTSCGDFGERWIIKYGNKIAVFDEVGCAPRFYSNFSVKKDWKIARKIYNTFGIDVLDLRGYYVNDFLTK